MIAEDRFVELWPLLHGYVIVASLWRLLDWSLSPSVGWDPPVPTIAILFAPVGLIVPYVILLPRWSVRTGHIFSGPVGLRTKIPIDLVDRVSLPTDHVSPPLVFLPPIDYLAVILVDGSWVALRHVPTGDADRLIDVIETNRSRLFPPRPRAAGWRSSMMLDGGTSPLLGPVLAAVVLLASLYAPVGAGRWPLMLLLLMSTAIVVLENLSADVTSRGVRTSLLPWRRVPCEEIASLQPAHWFGEPMLGAINTTSGRTVSVIASPLSLARIAQQRHQ